MSLVGSPKSDGLLLHSKDPLIRFDNLIDPFHFELDPTGVVAEVRLKTKLSQAWTKQSPTESKVHFVESQFVAALVAQR